MAGTNRFDSPAQAQFMQTYVPIDFDTILRAGQAKQSQYDVNRTGFEQSIADTQNLDYIPNSQDEKYIGQVKSNLEELRDQYIDKDYSDPEIVRQLYGDIRKNIKRDRIEKIQRSAQAYRNYQQLAAKSKAEGKSLFKEFDPTGYDTYTSGIFNQQPEPLHDWRTKKESYFNNVEPSSYTDKNTGETIRYIDNAKIASLAKAGLQDYIQSTEGNQELRDYVNRGGKEQDYLNYIYESLHKTGQEKIKREHQDWMPEYMRKSKEDKTIEFGGPTPIVGLHDKFSKLSDKLTLKTRTVATGFSTSMGGYSVGASPESKQETYYKGLSKEESTVVDNLQKNLFPKVKDKAKLYSLIKPIIDKINDQEISAYQESIPMLTFPSGKKGAEGLTESIFGGTTLSPEKVSGEYYNRKFYDPETGEVYSGKQFLKEAGTDTEVRVLNQFNHKHPFSVLTNDDNFAKSYQIIAGNKQYIMSSGSKESINGVNIVPREKALNNISKAIYTPGVDVPIKIYGVNATVTGIPTGFRVTIMDSDRKSIGSFEDVTEDKVLTQVEDALMSK